MKIKLFVLFTLMATISSYSFTEQKNRILKQSSDSIIYLIEEIPYPIRFAKKQNCNFTEREINLIREVSQMLPETYLTVKDDFFIEKNCIHDLKVNSLNENSARTHLASSQSGKITLTDRIFSYVKDGKLLQLNDIFSKKIIVHELTHQLDRKMGYSRSDDFRKINAWERSFGFLGTNKSKAEGFHREQGTDNPKEDLATQAEGFFFDADYLCKHPQSYVWFYYWIGPPKITASECPEEMNRPIDPRKVTDVGYIFISPTDEAAESNFGHSLLRLHMDPQNPFEDIIIEAAGNNAGMPALSGFETPEELAKKQELARKNQISRTDFMWQGATGQLEFKVHPLKFKLKWLETITLQGRDIHERIVGLTRLQRRVMIYMLNRDIKNLDENYNILTKNCATYIAQMINKALGDDVAQKNLFGIYTPKNIYETIAPIILKDMPVAEGDKTRLARLLPARERTLNQLKNNEVFKSVDFESLHETTENPEKTVKALEQMVKIAQLKHPKFSEKLKKELQSLVYSYTMDRSLYTQEATVRIYKELFKIFHSLEQQSRLRADSLGIQSSKIKMASENNSGDILYNLVEYYSRPVLGGIKHHHLG